MNGVESDAEAWRAVPGTTWIDRAPMTLREFALYDGQDMPTTVDRRWLWRLELAMGDAPIGSRMYNVRLDLLEYLRESCEHVWRETEAEDDFPAFKQCFWCNVVVGTEGSAN
jgi:hypothetical protein